LTASIIYNKADVMLLPASVNKAFGLERLCRLQGIDPSTLVGVGDAENDLDFLDYSGVSVAVANALPEVKSRCRFETRESNGRGVIEVIRKLLDRG
ncbi:MAG: HAD hydrolase family protein, partial [Bdellovibrionales bacterium]|nr:HAD hydrolase family protein [Bdellovibrionales bacterium]